MNGLLSMPSFQACPPLCEWTNRWSIRSIRSGSEATVLRGRVATGMGTRAGEAPAAWKWSRMGQFMCGWTLKTCSTSKTRPPIPSSMLTMQTSTGCGWNGRSWKEASARTSRIQTGSIPSSLFMTRMASSSQWPSHSLSTQRFWGTHLLHYPHHMPVSDFFQ